MSDGELSSKAVNQIQADGQGDVDANQVEDARVVGVEAEIAEPMLEQLIQAEQQRVGAGCREDLRRHPHVRTGVQTFSCLTTPRSPSGFMSKMTMRMKNVMASR